MPSPSSPSSLAMLEDCPRKYAWTWVDEIRGEGTRFTTFGTKVHKHLEDYYLRGVMPPIIEPEGNCAIALMAHLPPPQPGIRVEERRFVGRFEGTPDLTLGNRVWDHKTTSDHKWALTDLASNLQAAIYAHFVMQETGDLRIILQWNYVTREKRPRVLPVIQAVTFADIAPTLDRAHRLADIGQDIIANRRPALSLVPNLSACDKYGGCQHRIRCDLTPVQRLGSLMDQFLEKEESMTTSAADFQKSMNASHPPAPGALPPPPPPPGNPWDGLPETHVNQTQWYNANAPGGAAWVDKAPPAPPAPPPAPPPPPPINPPTTAPEAPTTAAPALPPESATASPYEAIAGHFDDLADLFRLLAAVPAKRPPGRPRKVT